MPSKIRDAAILNWLDNISDSVDAGNAKRLCKSTRSYELGDNPLPPTPPDSQSPQPNTGRKRTRDEANTTGLHSSPQSRERATMSFLVHTPPKRRRITDEEQNTDYDNDLRGSKFDADTTPRQDDRFRDEISRSSSRSQSQSQKSNRSSPVKQQLRRLALESGGLEVIPLQLGGESFPASARDLVERFDNIASRQSIVDASIEVSDCFLVDYVPYICIEMLTIVPGAC